MELSGGVVVGSSPSIQVATRISQRKRKYTDSCRQSIYFVQCDQIPTANESRKELQECSLDFLWLSKSIP